MTQGVVRGEPPNCAMCGKCVPEPWPVCQFHRNVICDVRLEDGEGPSLWTCFSGRHSNRRWTN